MENTNQKKFDEARKKNLKKYILWGCLALLVLTLSVMPMVAKREEEANGPVASVLSGNVETGSITTAINGGGTLSAENAEDVTLPASVKITEFLVKNGEEVKEGDAVAKVDKVSVMTAIVEVTETMEYLQEQIQSNRYETVSSYITASVGGRVKAVYAEKGDSVQDVMSEYGALAVLSLDSKMAVDIEGELDLRTGDSTTVILSDDTEITGRVETNLNGVATITVEDEGYAIGEKVAVTSDDGTRLGTGELYIHNAWKATGFTGTISNVYAREENTVYSGSNLFTLTDTDFTAQMEYMATQHREYEELLQKLCAMYDSGVITAPCDGVISGVDKNSTHLLSAEEGEYQMELLEADTSRKGWTVMLLSNVTPTVTCGNGKDCELPHDSLEHLETCIQACDRSGDCDAKVHHTNCIKSCKHADTDEGCSATVHYDDCIKSCVTADEEKECTSKKHYAGCIESCDISDGSTACAGNKYHHAACIENCDLTENCPSTKYHQAGCVSHCDDSDKCDAINHKSTCPLYGLTYTAYAAQVTACGEDLVLKADPGTRYTVEGTKTGWALKDAELRTDLMLTDVTIKNTGKLQCSAGDIVLIMTGVDSQGNVVVSNKVIVYRKSSASSGPAAGSMGDLSGMMSGMMSGMSGMSGMMSGMYGMYGYGMTGGTMATTQELFDLEGDVLMTVTPRSTVSLTITVDEKDISKLSIGQMAEVEVVALKGEVFEAEVTELGVIGTNNGGSSKFTVKLEMEMTPDMLDGMSATASIPLYTKMNVLTIPVAALVEEGPKTIVYTATDKKTGEPSAPVEVEIGVSDGEYAEVLSGLQSGDTYYYSYYDTLELSTAVESGGMSPFGR